MRGYAVSVLILTALASFGAAFVMPTNAGFVFLFALAGVSFVGALEVARG